MAVNAIAMKRPNAKNMADCIIGKLQKKFVHQDGICPAMKNGKLLLILRVVKKLREIN